MSSELSGCGGLVFSPNHLGVEIFALSEGIINAERFLHILVKHPFSRPDNVETKSAGVPTEFRYQTTGFVAYLTTEA